jgi:hypothetical protein
MPEGGFGTNFNVLIQSKGVICKSDFLYKKTSFQLLSELTERLS